MSESKFSILESERIFDLVLSVCLFVCMFVSGEKLGDSFCFPIKAHFFKMSHTGTAISNGYQPMRNAKQQERSHSCDVCDWQLLQSCLALSGHAVLNVCTQSGGAELIN